MATYSEELRRNRELLSVPPSPCYEEFKLLKINGKYKYDECYDYAQDVLPWLVNEYKKLGLTDYEVCARNTLFEKINPNISLHKRSYQYWTDMKWQEFQKDWKPKDTDGLNFVWLTLNYSDKLSVQDIVIETTRISNLALFKQTKITYCYEFYTEKGSHPHVHMLIEMKTTGTIKPSTLTEKIFQKKSLREVMNINYKLSWASDIKDRTQKRAIHIAYLNGMKIDKKQDYCDLDKQWRIENGLEELYIKDN